MSLDPFAPLSLILGQGGSPFKLEVSVTPSDEVQALRARVQALQHDMDDLQARYNRVEYLYRCECLVNSRLIDHCAERGYKVPKSLYQRPDSFVHLTHGDARA